MELKHQTFVRLRNEALEAERIRRNKNTPSDKEIDTSGKAEAMLIEVPDSDDEVDEGNQQWDVDCVLNHAGKHPHQRFEVSWKGLDENFQPFKSSWEPIESFWQGEDYEKYLNDPTYLPPAVIAYFMSLTDSNSRVMRLKKKSLEKEREEMEQEKEREREQEKDRLEEKLKELEKRSRVHASIIHTQKGAQKYVDEQIVDLRTRLSKLN